MLYVGSGRALGAAQNNLTERLPSLQGEKTGESNMINQWAS